MSTTSQNPWVVSGALHALDSDLNVFEIRHTLLASVVQTSTESSQTQSNLYHRHHHAQGSTLFIKTALTFDELSYVSMFREILLNHYTIHEETLMSLLTVSSGLSAQQDTDACESIVQSIISQVQKPAVTEKPSSFDGEISVSLYCIEVLARTDITLEDGGADDLIWKWAKPTSPYMKYGHWCTTIEEAIRQGVWYAGKGFVLLVEKVGKQRRERLFHGGRIPVTIVSNEELERSPFLCRSEQIG